MGLIERLNLKRRNRPVKYDRNLMGKTIVAMQRVHAVKEKREERFFANRMKDANHVKKAYARVEIEKNIEILAPAAAKREEVMRTVMDSARNRIATRKKGDRIISSTAKNNESMDES